ncbi:hypothetical protein BDR04DRAFT_1152263 [Suillus decipiens]|nr:hypothetical protein BDR04DRAFT_1152263 [Suillus decipiens]
MDSFKKWFQKCHGNKKPSLKHSKSMPFRLSQASMLEPYADPFKAVYHVKTPQVKTSDIMHAEQAPVMSDVHRAQWYQDVHNHPPSRPHFDAYIEDRFPNSQQPPPRPTRGALRTTSLNSRSIRPQLPPQNCNTRNQPAARRQRAIQQCSPATCSSWPTATGYPSRKQRCEATVDQTVVDLLDTVDGRPPVFGSSRQAERVRAKSSAGHSYTPVPSASTTHSPHSEISRAHSSRTNPNRSNIWF